MSPPRPKHNISHETLVDRYLVKQHTAAQIAEEFNVTRNTIVGMLYRGKIQRSVSIGNLSAAGFRRHGVTPKPKLEPKPKPQAKAQTKPSRIVSTNPHPNFARHEPSSKGDLYRMLAEAAANTAKLPA